MKELDLHITVVALIAIYRHPDLFCHHPANGEKRSPRAGARLKRMGVEAGTPDLCLTLPDGRSAFMEFKGPKGRLSPPQIAFRDKALRLGRPWACVDNPEAAMTTLAEWGALLPVAWSSQQSRGQRHEPLVPLVRRHV
jgi:hypothetical protein